MKQFKFSRGQRYCVALVSLLVPFYYTSKALLKFDTIATTIAVFSTSLTFMLSPVSISSVILDDVPRETNFSSIDANLLDEFDETIEHLSIDSVFDNINNNLEFLSNNTLEENIQPIIPVLVKPDNAGEVIRKTYTAGTTTNFIGLSSGFINNATTIDNSTVMNTIAQSPDMDILGDGSIEVLIMHTHATETYLEPGQTEWFDLAYDGRTTDSNKNVIRVGDEIATQLENAGIGVIHDTTLHDYPSFNGAYDRSAVTVKAYLEENPNIKVVLDVHRDAIVNDSTTITSPITNINGKDAAQIMIISGCDNGLYNMPNYMENLKFASALQSQMEMMYPSLTRPILFDYRKYNQDLTTGSILLEMGGHANTLEEAVYSGELLGKALAEVLLDLRE